MPSPLSDIDDTKRKNIIEMALTFSAMIRLFSKGSKLKIEAQLEGLFSNLEGICSRADYEARHRSFCEWFIQAIWTAEKMQKNGKLLPSQQASYGQAAKVLDIAIKVYVYYCGQPSLAGCGKTRKSCHPERSEGSAFHEKPKKMQIPRRLRRLGMTNKTLFPQPVRDCP